METYDRVLSYLMQICGKREYCRKELMDKALKRMESVSPVGEASAVAERMMDELQKGGFLDEMRYSCAFARDKAVLTGWGPVKIAAALRQKGIDSATVHQALMAIDAAKAEDKLYRSALAKYKVLEADPAARLKLLRFILSKGYDYPAAQAMADRVTAVSYEGE